jgi:blue copper oxidase
MKKILLLHAFACFTLIEMAAQNFVNPLFIPPTIVNNHIDLTVKTGTKQFYGSGMTQTMGVNGNHLAPTLIVNKGDSVHINVTNKLSEITTLHWHGLHIPSIYDGSPHNVINPNETWKVHFKIFNNASTNWYHPHPHENTVPQVLKGVVGMLIVRDNIESALALPRTYGVDDLPVILQDATFDANANFSITPFTALGDSLLVNGTMRPFVDAPAQIVRLRILNGATSRIFKIGFADNRTFHVIASDGGLLAKPVATTRLTISNGERYEILVNLSQNQGQDVFLKGFGTELPTSSPGGQNVGQMNGTSPLNKADFTILRLKVGAPTANLITTIPTSLTTVTPINPNTVNKTRTKILAGMGMPGAGEFTINGRQFDMNYINDTVRLNDTEIWEITNNTTLAHPFHIHDIQFYVLSRNGVAPLGHEGSLKDVVLVNPNETVRFITKFTDFAGTTPYMYHCHNLGHEDHNMMGQFIVAAATATQDLPKDESIRLSPNPLSIQQILTIEANTAIQSVHIFDVLGREVGTQKGHNTLQMTLNLPLAKGLYLFNIETNNGVAQRKVVVVD